MPGTVIVLISIREYDSRVSQNINNNRRSTRLIPYILSIEHNEPKGAPLGFYIYLGGLRTLITTYI